MRMPGRLIFYLIVLVVILMMSGCGCSMPTRPEPPHVPQELWKDPEPPRTIPQGADLKTERKVHIENVTLHWLAIEQVRDLQELLRKWSETWRKAWIYEN